MEIYINKRKGLLSDSFSSKENKGVENNITLKNYKLFLDWSLMNHLSHVTINGGEPLLHPEIREILKLTKEYQSIIGFQFILITNGIHLNKIFDLLDGQTSIMIKAPNPEDLSEEELNSFNKNLDYLNKLRNDREKQITFSVICFMNEYCMNYDYFWNVVDKYDLHKIALKIQVPTESLFKNNIDRYYKTIRYPYLKFVNDCQGREKTFIAKCNVIPTCYFTGPELNFINLTRSCEIMDYFGCRLGFSLDPNLKLFLCIDEISPSIDKTLGCFSSIDEIEDYVLSKENDYYSFLKKCSSCILKEMAMCHCGCYLFNKQVK